MRKTANVPPPALYVEFLRLIIVRKPKFNILYAGRKNIDYRSDALVLALGLYFVKEDEI